MELKNDISIKGTLKSVDQYLNIKLDDIGVLEEVRYPHMVRWQSRGGFVGGARRQECADNLWNTSLPSRTCS